MGMPTIMSGRKLASRDLRPSVGDRLGQAPAEATVASATNESAESKTPIPTVSARDSADQSEISERDDITVPQLFILARRHIDLGVASLRQAAEYLAAAQNRGATQRESAEAVSRSVGWVNGLLAWRARGYDGSPFGPASKESRKRAKNVQATERGSIQIESQLEADELIKADDTASARTCAAQMNSEAEPNKLTELTMAAGSCTVPVEAALGIPALLDRRDPDRAFELLLGLWPTSSFGRSFLDAPIAARRRFVNEVMVEAAELEEAASAGLGGASP